MPTLVIFGFLKKINVLAIIFLFKIKIKKERVQIKTCFIKEIHDYIRKKHKYCTVIRITREWIKILIFSRKKVKRMVH